MKDIKEILKQLNTDFPKWYCYLDGSSDNDDLNNLISDLLNTFKEICKEKNSDDLSIFLDYINDEKIAISVQEIVNKSMIYYNVFKPLRIQSFENPDAIKAMIDDIFYNYILRVDPKINERYEDKINLDRNSINDILTSMDYLTDYYVKRLMIQTEVEKDFEEETGFSKEVCEFYAELFEKNFFDLKLNLIMYGIEFLKQFKDND